MKEEEISSRFDEINSKLAQKNKKAEKDEEEAERQYKAAEAELSEQLDKSPENQEIIAKILKKKDYDQLSDMGKFSINSKEVLGATKDIRLNFLRKCLTEIEQKDKKMYKNIVLGLGEHSFKDELPGNNEYEKEQAWRAISDKDKMKFSENNLEIGLDRLADTGIVGNPDEWALANYRNEKIAEREKEQLKTLNKYLDEEMSRTADRTKLVEHCFIASLLLGLPGLIGIGIFLAFKEQHTVKALGRDLKKALEEGNEQEVDNKVKELESSIPGFNVNQFKANILQSGKLVEFKDNMRKITKFLTEQKEINKEAIKELEKNEEELTKEEQAKEEPEIERTEMMGASDRLGL